MIGEEGVGLREDRLRGLGDLVGMRGRRACLAGFGCDAEPQRAVADAVVVG